jgi:hypothetical protein
MVKTRFGVSRINYGKEQQVPTGAYPDFLLAAPETTACAAFIKKSRMKLASATNLYRKSGVA